MVNGVERARRWPPRLKILLSESGRAACDEYQRVVAESRAAKQDPDEHLGRWAGTLGIRPGDGMLLEEALSAEMTAADLARAVEACGLGPAEVKAGVDRLYGAGLIEPRASEQPSPPRY